jgi:acyl-CoA synthetase (NDP forming)
MNEEMRGGSRFSREHIDRLLRPHSIAIVGASANPGAFGASVLANLEDSCYPGALHPINPKREEIGGRPCLRSIDDLPEGVDCAVLAIPRAGVLDAMAACARRRVAAVVVFSAGFAETGAAGRADQDRLRQIANEGGMIVLGPNCLGIANHLDRIPLTFVACRTERPKPGRGIALISQSGAIAAALGVSLRQRDLGVSLSVSTGNEAVVGIEDFLEYVVGEPDTRLIALIAEQIRQPQRFLSLVARARQAGQRVILLHPGRSSAARAAATTHTGAMAGDYDVMRTVVEHSGVVVLETLEEFLDTAEILARCPGLPSGGTAVIAESGFFKALALDFGEKAGLSLPPLSDDCAEALRKELPDFIPATNPLDLTAQGLVDPTLYRRVLGPMLADGRYGAAVLAIILSDERTGAAKLPPIVAALREIQSAKPVVFAPMDQGAPVSPEFVQSLRDIGVPFFSSAERAMHVLAILNAYQSRVDGPSRVPRTYDGDAEHFHGVLPEYRGKEALARAGICVPEGKLVQTLAEAQAAAARIGFPVALKAQAAMLAHKSDVGGVELNLAGAEELAAAWRRMADALAGSMGGLALDGFLVEKMAGRGVELIVGGRNDTDWGPVLLVGLGGVLAEALREVRLLPPDLEPDAILRELEGMKLGVLLRGVRGGPPMDIAAAADLIRRVGKLMLSTPSIREIDINPVLVRPQGQGCVALDALIAGDTEATGAKLGEG